jgi:predicted PurR-regulated permease PerM
LPNLAWGDTVAQWQADLAESSSGLLTSVAGAAQTIGRGLTEALLVLVGGIYLAAQSGLYRTGFLKLVPAHGRGLLATALDDSGRALKLWLMGQLVSMVLVGTLTGLGLWLIGIPSALTLGLVAGVFEFVPIIGPILAAIPALLLAFIQGPEYLLWTAILYLLIQQAEGNLIQPIVQRVAVDMPPALLLFAIVAGGTLFGAAGILLAAPLAVTMFVMVKRLYVREMLGVDTPLPGEKPEANS